MWGANVPLIYYSFACSPTLRIVYWTLASVLAVCCSYVTFQPKFSLPHLRPLRAATFGSLALSIFIPVIHGFVENGPTQHRRIGLPWVLATLALNTIGAAAYAAKVCHATCFFLVPFADDGSSPKNGSRDDSISSGQATSSCTFSSSLLDSHSPRPCWISLTICMVIQISARRDVRRRRGFLLYGWCATSTRSGKVLEYRNTNF